jgi:hypothetical protein
MAGPYTVAGIILSFPPLLGPGALISAANLS